jgi:uncharacterized protein
VAEAVFWWWFVGSMLAFVLVIVFGIVDRAARTAAWMYRKARQTAQRHVAADSDAAAPTPSRRHFLQQAAVLVSATPFVAAGYGLLYERLDVEVVRQRIHLARLPKAFEGFRIAQLSDIHMGPFTSADYTRRCVAITNGSKPDLIVLTGDYIGWDPGPKGTWFMRWRACVRPTGSSVAWGIMSPRARQNPEITVFELTLET